METKNKVFILASGTSRRFNGKIKHLLPVFGEPIIRRTIRIIRQISCFEDYEIYVVTHHKELKFDDVKIIDTIFKPRQLCNTILMTRPYWGDKNVILLGDVVYGERALACILSSNFNGIEMFYKDSCDVKPNSERYAVRFSSNNADLFGNLLNKASRVFEGSSMEDYGGLYKICFATRTELFLQLTSPLTYTDRRNTWLRRLIRPFRDYFVYHIYQTWKPARIIKLRKINDIITTDIDSQEDYDNFMRVIKDACN